MKIFKVMLNILKFNLANKSIIKYQKMLIKISFWLIDIKKKVKNIKSRDSKIKWFIIEAKFKNRFT
jgi:hypothetical protein